MGKLTANELRSIIRLSNNNGYSIRQLADIFNVSRTTIHRTIKRNREHGNVTYRHGGGRLRKTTVAQDNFLRVSVRRRPIQNATQLNNALRATTGVHICNQTVRRRLHEVHLRARRRAICPLLKIEHRAARRLWANEHQNWGIAEWSRCLFTDESRFTLCQSDGRVLVWRGTNERFDERNMSARVAFGGGGVTVWGGIMVNGKTELVILMRESMNAERYRDMCVRDIVVPIAHNFGNDLILVDDNARPHRARIVTEELRNHNIERMEWPARSPDMNPIEHVWSRMKLRLNRRAEEFLNLNELLNAIQEEWEAIIPQAFINTLIESMPSRVASVLRVRGGPTKY